MSASEFPFSFCDANWVRERKVARSWLRKGRHFPFRDRAETGFSTPVTSLSRTLVDRDN